MNDMNFAKARHNMVEQQIRTWTVLDFTVLETIENFPRERFVPEQYQKVAYSDVAIPLAHGQEMLHPKIEAHLLQAADVKSTDNVLEIGTGSGCVTALLATLAKHVDSVDIFSDMQAEASKTLQSNNINNVTMIEGDASAGWGNKDQYDVVAITGSMPELPQQYIDALKVGGRLFAVIGEGETMEAIQITRPYGDKWEKKSLFETYVPALVNASKPPEFVF